MVTFPLTGLPYVYLALTVATILDSLKVRYVGRSMVTWNFGRMYSATWKCLEKLWPDTTAVMFQSPKTGWSDNCSSDANTPCLVNTRFHCLILFPLPSYIDKRVRFVTVRDNVKITYRHVNIQRTDDRWFELRIDDNDAELYQMSRFVNGLIRLDENRVTLFRVFQFRCVDKRQSTRSTGCQIIFTGSQFTNLPRINGSNENWNKRFNFLNNTWNLMTWVELGSTVALWALRTCPPPSCCPSMATTRLVNGAPPCKLMDTW